RDFIKPTATQDQIKAAMASLENRRAGLHGKMLTAMRMYREASAELTNVDTVYHAVLVHYEPDEVLNAQRAPVTRTASTPTLSLTSMSDMLKDIGIEVKTSTLVKLASKQKKAKS
ncbi:MAG: hypothetical protein MN733_04335, partial [Nitrososphaera sp.]|nr:hypothetical protein [Nitrososphaera sp.]